MNSAQDVTKLIDQFKASCNTMSEAAWQTALACVGWPYVYSAWGEECTPSERRKRYGMRPDKTTIKTKCQVIRDSNPKSSCTGCQWYPDGKRTRCFDCRGFTDWILKQFGFDLYGDTVAAQWNHKENWLVKGEIGRDPIPQNVLVNIFIKNSSGKWTHTGFYYNGQTCECSVGVQHFNPMKKDRWTHWAVAACFKNGWETPVKEPEKQPAKEPEKGQTVSYKTLRRGNYGELVKELQTKLRDLGYDLGVCGVDGDFGQATEKAVKAFQKDHGLKVDGIVGEQTHKALNSIQPVQAVKTYTVTVSHLTEDEMNRIVSEFGDRVINTVEG